MTRLVAALLLASPAMALAADGLTLIPNSSGRSLSTPTAWGLYSRTVSLGVGATFPQAYSGDTEPSLQDNQEAGRGNFQGDGERDGSGTNDGAISLTHGFGRPELYGGAQVSVTMNDVDDTDLFTFGFKVHRYFGFGISMALGGENLLPTDNSDSEESFYFVISRASQRWASGREPGDSRLQMSLGVGSGRFANKSPLDVVNGKGENGSIVFGSVALDVGYGVNAIVEWTGVNLGVGVSRTFGKTVPISLSLGFTDLINSQSGDDPRFIASGGVSYYYGN